MNILVTGGGGFIGSAIVECLLAAGHRVRACGRSARNLPQVAEVDFQRGDISRMVSVDDWLALLDGVDAVVNVAGILREQRSGEFDRIHCQAPLALAEAARQAGISRWVQVSALGSPEDGEFIASKHRLDAQLLGMAALNAVVLRPSVVVSLRGSYGGTSMLRALAGMPGMLCVPGDGRQRVQPIRLEDLAAMVVASLGQPPSRPVLVEAVGPDVLTLEEFLLAQRRWLKLPPPRVTLRVPAPLVGVAARCGELLRAGPMGRTMWRMLQRGNVGAESVPESAGALGDFKPRSVVGELSRGASFVQDRWHARLYWLRPLAWLALVVIWLVSALAGFLANPTNYQADLDAFAVPLSWQSALVMTMASWNMLLGLWLLSRRWMHVVLPLMLLSVFAYTVVLGGLLPWLWLELYGGLVKNLAIIALIAFSMALESKR